MINLTVAFATFAAFAAVTVAASEGLIKSFKIEKGWAKQLVSWLLPIVFGVVGFLCQLGIFAEFGPITDWMGWVFTILTGLGAGLVANGLYDIKGVQVLLNAIEDLIRKLFHKNEQPKADNAE